MPPVEILVVEDEGVIGRDIQSTLRRFGYDVPVVLRRGEDALSHVQAHAPDLIIMDIRLAGGMDGIDAARRIRDERPVPVIYLTAYADEETLARARETEPYGYLLKPFTGRELRSAVETALGRHRTLRELEMSARQFEDTLRRVTDGVIAADAHQRVSFMNPPAEEMTGWDSNEAVGKPLSEVLRLSEDVPPAGGEANGGGPKHAGTEWRLAVLSVRSGASVPVHFQVKKEGSQGQGPMVLLRKRAAPPADGEPEDPEIGQEGQNPHLIGIVDSISDPLFAVDAHWRVTYLNRQAAQHLDKTPGEVLGELLWEEFPETGDSEFAAELREAQKLREPRFAEFYHEELSTWFEVHAYPFADGLLVFFQDITERKESEEQSRKRDKLESLGLLARGFAHDFNNILTVLLGHLSLTCREVGENPPALAEIDNARKAATRAQNLVQQVLTFSKGGLPIREEQDLVDLIEETLGGIDRKPGIAYVFKPAREPAVAEVDGDQIERLLLNLIRNAEQAMGGDGESGKLTITCRNVERPVETDDGEVSGELHSYVRIRVTDTGEGIPADLLPRIFEPYFSTREDVNASGIGLTVCDSIVRAHGGYLEVDSREGEGTTIRVFLPAASEPEGSDLSDESDESDESDGSETESVRILVLEDDPMIRQLVVANLGAAGHEVDTEDEGGRAVEAYRRAFEDGNPYEVVLMDLTIPHGMGGGEALEKIREFDPDVCAIVSSGYYDDPVMANFEDYGFRAVLPKPYEPSELRELVEQLCKEE